MSDGSDWGIKLGSNPGIRTAIDFGQLQVVPGAAYTVGWGQRGRSRGPVPVPELRTSFRQSVAYDSPQLSQPLVPRAFENIAFTIVGPLDNRIRCWCSAGGK